MSQGSRCGSQFIPSRVRAPYLTVGTGSVPTSEGSTVFGDTLDDTHIFTGSIYITGSLTLSGSISGLIPSIGSSTDNAIVRWDGVGGNKIQNSNVVIDDSGNTYISGTLDVTGSSKFGYLNSEIHQFTGSVFLPSTYLGYSVFTGSQVIISGSVYLPTTWQGTTTFTGSNVYMSSSLEVSGSSKFGYDSTKNHIFTGSTYMSGNLHVQGYNTIVAGTTPIGSTGSYGIGTHTNHSSSPFVVYSNRTNGQGNDSIRVIANVGVATINANHSIMKIGYIDDRPQFTASWNITNSTIEAAESSSAELLGTVLDGASAIGTIVGSDNSYTTAGSKLLSIQNNTYERAYYDYDGSRTYGVTDFGGYLKDTYFSNLISISGSTLYYSSTNVPAGASIMGVGARIITDFQTASVIALGISGSTTGFTEYWGNSMGYLAGVTNSTSSLKSGNTYVSLNTPICVSSSVLQGNAITTGSIRIECFYRTINVPNS